MVFSLFQELCGKKQIHQKQTSYILLLRMVTMMIMDQDIKEIVATPEEIGEVIKRLGEKITEDYCGKKVVMVGLLNGCNPLFSDLLRNIGLMVTVDYMRASSYPGTIKSSKEVKILKDLDCSIAGKDVIVVDDIIDTGRTLKCIFDLLSLKGAKSIESCVLMDKKVAREVDYDAKYVGCIIPQKFVIGYGLDYKEYYRNLPYVG